MMGYRKGGSYINNSDLLDQVLIRLEITKSVMEAVRVYATSKEHMKSEGPKRWYESSIIELGELIDRVRTAKSHASLIWGEGSETHLDQIQIHRLAHQPDHFQITVTRENQTVYECPARLEPGDSFCFNLRGQWRMSRR